MFSSKKLLHEVQKRDPKLDSGSPSHISILDSRPIYLSLLKMHTKSLISSTWSEFFFKFKKNSADQFDSFRGSIVLNDEREREIGVHRQIDREGDRDREREKEKSENQY